MSGKTSLLEKLCGGSGGAEKDGGKCESKCNKCEESKCPPMPCFNTGDCKPAWLCSPDKITTKTYPVPAGVKIVPISKGGRSGSKSGGGSGGGSTNGNKCGTCGRSDDGAKSGPPKVPNKDCPMMKPRCPPKDPPGAEKKESGLFAKISSFFGKK